VNKAFTCGFYHLLTYYDITVTIFVMCMDAIFIIFIRIAVCRISNVRNSTIRVAVTDLLTYYDITVTIFVFYGCNTFIRIE